VSNPVADYRGRRTGLWLTWLSPCDLVWLWHALFDGTRVCRCRHSRERREARR
jgi:hypothetical protein